MGADHRSLSLESIEGKFPDSTEPESLGPRHEVQEPTSSAKAALQNSRPEQRANRRADRKVCLSRRFIVSVAGWGEDFGRRY